MGVLYLAVAGDRGFEKLCAVKTVLPHMADADYVARFRDEAQVVVKLHHGNLVQVYEVGQVDDELYLSMEFVEGKDLRAVWNQCAKKGIAFPLEVAVHIAKELCRGLSYAHGFGGMHLVHRDVSPPNILIAYSGEVKLTDFGLARSTLKSGRTRPGLVYGKVSYMSPEQARGEDVDGRSDLYAAGVVLWELLTGRQLFPQGERAAGDLLQVVKAPEVAPPSSRTSRVPKALDDIVLRSLSADRKNRYDDAEQMRSALAEFLAQYSPSTDAATITQFLGTLFPEEIAKERRELAAAMEEVAKEPPAQVLTQADNRPAGSSLPPATNVARGDLPEAPLGRDQRGEQQRVGTLVDGRYRILGCIGQGGMGSVYAAEHVEIGRRVALKILHPAYSRTPELVERFRREARAASRIGHPNIVEVMDSGTTPDDCVYFVMEYLEGVELAHIISETGALGVERALAIAGQVCRAVAAAHAAQIIHRDLKPENIFLVTRNGSSDFVKILDFGIARQLGIEEAREQRITQPGIALGTPEYMAPEQAAGRPYDHRVDLYAISAILYEMLCGVPPFQGDNLMELLSKKATQVPIAPRMLRPELPETIEAVIMRTLSTDPNARPATAEALEYELNKAYAGRGVAVGRRLGLAPAVLPGSVLSSMEPLDAVGLTTERLQVTSRIQTFRWWWIGAAASLALIVGLIGRNWGASEPPSVEDEIAKAESGPPEAGGPGNDARRREAKGEQGSRTAAEPPKEEGHGPGTAGAVPDRAAADLPGAAPPPGDRPSEKKAKGLAAGAPEPAVAEGLVRESQAATTAGLSSRKEGRQAERRRILEAQNALLQGRFDKAKQAFQAVLHSPASGAGRAAATLGLGQVAWQQGHYEDALRYARQSAELGAGLGAKVLLGHTYYKLGRYGDAKREYSAVLKTNAAHMEARRGLEAVERQQGR